MWRDAFRPDTFGAPQKAARSNPFAPEGRGATHSPPFRGRAWRAGLTARAAPCGTCIFLREGSFLNSGPSCQAPPQSAGPDGLVIGKGHPPPGTLFVPRSATPPQHERSSREPPQCYCRAGPKWSATIAARSAPACVPARTPPLGEPGRAVIRPSRTSTRIRCRPPRSHAASLPACGQRRPGPSSAPPAERP